MIALLGIVTVFLEYIDRLMPIMPALCSMLLVTYYAFNYAGIIGRGLFRGESDDEEFGTFTFQEWLERFEMIANICIWSLQAKLVNLVIRLHGQAYSFFSLVLLSNVPIILN